MSTDEQLCRQFSLHEIKEATNNFDDELIIGKGGFGSVYLGGISNGEKFVAIKRLSSESNQGDAEFLREIETLSRLQHDNLVRLEGYCNESNEKILVYEYMQNGTLDDHLYKSQCGATHKMAVDHLDKSQVSSSRVMVVDRKMVADHYNSQGFFSYHLTWEERLNISIGAAQGLDFLHRGVVPRVIHRDIKDSNILIDSNLRAKIADFGLAKLVKLTSDPQITSVSTTIVKGTFGYLDPEYFFTQKLTTKTDVYAFGVVLLVILSGRKAVDNKVVEDQRSLTEWATKCITKKRLDLIIDPYLAGRISSKSLQQYVKIVQKCLCRKSEQRPTMKEVVAGLQLALKKQPTTSGTNSRQPGGRSSSTQMAEAKLRIIMKEMIMKETQLGDIVRRLLEWKGRRVNLSEEEIKLLCVRAQQIFLSQPNLLEVKAPIKICGDMRGNYENLLSIFEFGGFPPSSAYLFLGDYVDRAEQSLDTILLLLAYKILYPDKVFLLRGKYDGSYGKCDTSFFECLPVAALVGGKIFCVHGGLSPELKHMKQIEELPRPTTIPEDGLLRDLLWSTPSSEINGWGMDSGHYSYMFGPDKVAEFLKNNELDLICRSGLVVDGYEFFAERGLVTICSAACRYFSEYPEIEDCNYDGAILTVDESMMCSFEILRKEYPEAFYARKFQFRRGPVFNTKTKVGCWNNEDWSRFVGK